MLKQNDFEIIVDLIVARRTSLRERAFEEEKTLKLFKESAELGVEISPEVMSPGQERLKEIKAEDQMLDAFYKKVLSLWPLE